MTVRVADKVAALERLAANPGAAPGERSNALSAAVRLRERSPGSFEAPLPPPRPSPPPPQWGHVESRGGIDCWVGSQPMHGPICGGGGEGLPGCPECARIAKWRRWLQGVRT